MNRILLSFFLIISFFTSFIFAKEFKVSYDPDYAPYTYNINGKPYGLLIDIFKSWAEVNDHQVEFINGRTWENSLDIVKSSKVDFFIGTEPYEDWMKGSSVIYKAKTSLFKLKESSIKSKNIIGIIGEDYKEHLEQDFGDKLAYVKSYDTYEELSNALVSEDVDFIYDDKIALETFFMQNRLNHLIEKSDDIQVFSNIQVISNDTNKIALFNKSYQQIPKELLLNIENNWVINQKDKYYTNTLANLLNQKEKEWLYNNPISRVAVMDYWPHDINGNSLHTEVLKLINKYIGTNLVPVKYDKWTEGFKRATKGDELHGTMGLSWSKEREDKYFFYTPAYDFTPCYLIVRKNNTSIKDLDDLKDKTLYLKENEIAHKIIEDKVPSAKVIDLPDVDSMYKRLSLSREADALFSYFIDRNKLEDYGLKIAKKVYDRYGEVSIGINHKYPELNSIINKAFKTIPRKEFSELRDKNWGEERSRNNIFTTQELQWIKENPIITVGAENDWAPFDFVDEAGNYTGLARDYLDIIEKNSGLKLKYDTSKTWSELLEAIKQKEVDILPALYFSEDRKEYINFTTSYLSLSNYVFTKKGYPKIDNLTELNGKTIAQVKGYEIIPWLKENYPDINIIEKDSILEALKSVKSGESIAFIGDNPSTTYNIEKNFITDLELNSVLSERKAIKLYMGVRKDYEILANIITKSINSITKQEKAKISSKWMTLLEKDTIVFSDDEKRWLKRQGNVKYVYDPDWAPFEWMSDAGEHKGIIADVLKIISDKTNMKFEAVHSDSWDGAIENIKNKKAMMYSAVSQNQLGNKNVHYTKEVIYEIPTVIVSRSDDSNIYLNLERIPKDKEIAVVKSSALEGYVRKNFPNLKILTLDSNIEGFEKLSDDEIDLFILSASTAEYFIKAKGFDDIKVSTKIDYTYYIKMAVAKDAPKELLSILDKALATISQKEFSDIYHKWTNIVISEKTNWKLFFQILGVVSLVILFLIFNNAKLNQRVREKTADILKQKEELEDLSKNLELKVIERTKEIDEQKKQIEIILENILLPVLITSKKDRKILYANKYAEIQYETSFEKLMGSNIDSIYTIENQKDQILKEMSTKGYVENLEQHYKTFSGKEFIGLLSVKPIIYEGLEAYIGMVTDITRQKEIEEEIRQIHKHTRDSIEYASLIQHSIVPDNELFRKYFSDYLALWHPKDIVGGDIYLFEELRNENECLLMVIDCTGHGVPGAFVTMLVKAIERQIIAKINHDPTEVVSPANLLGVFNRSMKHLLKQEEIDSISNAGFDGGILYYNKKEKIVKFSGAETPLFYMEDGELKTIKGSRHSVGYKKSDASFEFKEHVIEVKEGMQFYLATDGYLDQNGGAKGFPFGKRRFLNIIKEYYNESFADQQEVFLEELHKYQRDEERNDDITLIGVKI